MVAEDRWMKRTFTAKEKALVFNLWKSGTGFSEIAKVLDSKPGTLPHLWIENPATHLSSN